MELAESPQISAMIQEILPIQKNGYSIKNVQDLAKNFGIRVYSEICCGIESILEKDNVNDNATSFYNILKPYAEYVNTSQFKSTFNEIETGKARASISETNPPPKKETFSQMFNNQQKKKLEM
jgi:hypothetical protein